MSFVAPIVRWSLTAAAFACVLSPAVAADKKEVPPALHVQIAFAEQPQIRFVD